LVAQQRVEQVTPAVLKPPGPDPARDRETLPLEQLVQVPRADVHGRGDSGRVQPGIIQPGVDEGVDAQQQRPAVGFRGQRGVAVQAFGEAGHQQIQGVVGQARRRRRIVLVEVTGQAQEERRHQRARAVPPGDRHRGQLPDLLLAQRQQLVREHQHQHAERAVKGHLIGPARVVDGEVARPDRGLPAVLAQQGVTPHLDAQLVQVGRGTANQLGRAQDPVPLGTHLEHLHGTQRSAAHLSPERRPAGAAHVQGDEGVGHGVAPEVKALGGRHLRGTNDDAHDGAPKFGTATLPINATIARDNAVGNTISSPT
jgi:hypothetical protein